jgi:hypothetical protein
MAVPVSQMWAVASYVLKQRILRRKRYATVLMLEPLLRCNLACAGCGKIQYPSPHPEESSWKSRTPCAPSRNAARPSSASRAASR